MEELKLPELGEGIEKVEITNVLVAVGDFVRRDQPVVEVETEKASLEVPSTTEGRVVALKVKAGDKLAVGETILTVEPAESPEAAEPRAAEAPRPAAPVAVAETSPPPPVAAPALAAEVVTGQQAPVIDFPSQTAPSNPPQIGLAVPAAPSARALARQLGVDINEVPGTGPAGRISREDVKVYAKQLIQGGAGRAAPGASGPAAELPDFSRFGETEREALTNVRRATARNMATAWSTVPHVTQFDDADISQLESMRKRFNKRPEAADRKLTMTAIVLKMVASVLKQFPKFNASLDLAADSVVFKKYVHIGVAVDTDRGLLVPVIRDVDQKTLLQVAVELNDLAARARGKKLKPDELAGASFTVSNLGGLGTTYFSPIVNWPETAILGVGRAKHEAVWEDGQFQPRLMMPLSLSYDHRVIDGADTARFLRRLAEALEQPLLLLLDD